MVQKLWGDQSIFARFWVEILKKCQTKCCSAPAEIYLSVKFHVEIQKNHNKQTGGGGSGGGMFESDESFWLQVDEIVGG